MNPLGSELNSAQCNFERLFGVWHNFPYLSWIQSRLPPSENHPVLYELRLWQPSGRMR